MKKRKKIIMLSIIVLIIIGAIIFLLLRKENKEAESTGSTYKDVSVSTMTIENTLTSSGEVTNDSADLSLNTYRYFKEMYYSVGDYVPSGANILRYTNGKYFTAPYDLVITGYSLPDAKGRIKSNHYIQVKNVKTLKMSLSIDETEINKVAVNQEVSITLNAFEDVTYTGKITDINQIGTYSSSGSKYTATVEFTNDGNVKLGMSGTVSITVEKAEDVIAVPIEAIQTEGSTKYVVVVTENTSNNVTVETGISNAAYVEVKSGLTGDETVRMIETESTSTNSFGFGNMDMKEMMNNRGNGDRMTPPSGNFTPGN